MNSDGPKYAQYALVKEMMEVVDVVKNFEQTRMLDVADEITQVGKLLLTGEGSSRIFPAKNAIRKALTWGADLQIITDGSRQAALYDLSKTAVFCASNSGRTKEVVLLAKKLAEMGNKNRYALTANEGTLLAEACTKTFVLNCGWEHAVAATKSVVEQALFYEYIVRHISGQNGAIDCAALAEALNAALRLEIDETIIDACAECTDHLFRRL